MGWRHARTAWRAHHSDALTRDPQEGVVLRLGVELDAERVDGEEEAGGDGVEDGAPELLERLVGR